LIAVTPRSRIGEQDTRPAAHKERYSVGARRKDFPCPRSRLRWSGPEVFWLDPVFPSTWPGTLAIWKRGLLQRARPDAPISHRSQRRWRGTARRDAGSQSI